MKALDKIRTGDTAGLPSCSASGPPAFPGGGAARSVARTE